jgi:hypothetical protein
MTAQHYPIYKGLQKPLEYRGFKGKFIYWGVGSLVGGLVLGGLIGALTNMVLGTMATLTLMAGGIAYTMHRQKDGLHDKARYTGVFIHRTNLTMRHGKGA